MSGLLAGFRLRRQRAHADRYVSPDAEGGFTFTCPACGYRYQRAREAFEATGRGHAHLTEHLEGRP